MKYEYMKVDLNIVGPRLADIDLLNELGKARWRLVLITAHNVGYLIRDIPEPTEEPAPKSKHAIRGVRFRPTQRHDRQASRRD